MAWETTWWIEGAETGTTLAVDSITGTASVTSANLRTGALGGYAYQVNNGGRIAFNASAAYAANNQVNAQMFWAKMDTNNSFGFEVQAGGAASSVNPHLAFNGLVGTVTAYDASGTVLATSSGGAWPSDGTWFKVEWHFEYQTSTPLVSVFIDGTEVLTFTGSGSISSCPYRAFENKSTSDTLYIDDIVCGVEDSATSVVVEIDADVHVVGYRSNLTGQSPDFGGCSIDSPRNWSDMQELPFGSNSVTLSSAGGSATSNDYSGVITNDLGGADNSGGPSGDTGASNTWSLISFRADAYAARTNGGSPTSYGINWGKWNGSTYTNIFATTGGNLTTSLEHRPYYLASDGTNAPTSSDWFACGGYHTNDGGRDIIISEWLVQTTIEVTASGNTLSANAGSYTLTGSAVDFDVAMEADAGSYAYTGSAANFKLGKTFAAESGSYSVTGEAADFLNGEVLGAESGSYTYTGEDANFLDGEVLAAESGSYSVTGADANFLTGVTLQAESGSYTYTGSDANFPRGYVLTTQERGVATADFTDSSTDNTKRWTNAANAGDGSTSTFATTDDEGFYDPLYSIETVPVTSGINLATLRLEDALPTGGTNLVEKVRFRAYISVTGSGTPQMEVSARGTYLEAGAHKSANLGQYYFTQTTPGWTDWTQLPPPADGWGVFGSWDAIRGPVTLIFAGQDNTGTMTEARVYTAQLEVTYSDAVYQVDFQVPIIAATQDDLLANAGSYAYTGSDANFSISKTLSAESGSYSVTGSAADFYNDWVIEAEAGSYAYTGSAVNFITEGDLLADPGSYTYTGSDANLAVNHVLKADAGSYGYTGSAVNFNVAFEADAGAYTYTGSDVDFKREYAHSAEAGSYAYTGANVEFRLGVTLSAEAGSYTYTGSDADFADGYALAVESGTYSVSGSNAEFKRGIVLPAESGSYIQTGADVAFSTEGSLLAESGSYIYTGSDADLIHVIPDLLAASGSYSYTGADVNFAVEGASTRRIIMIG